VLRGKNFTLTVSRTVKIDSYLNGYLKGKTKRTPVAQACGPGMDV